MNNLDLHWQQVCPLEQIPRLGARVIESARANIAVFRTKKDEIFALEDKCPHRGGPLSQGIVFDKFVACPLHDRIMHLDTGKARAPDTGCAQSFPVKVIDGMIYIALNKD